MGQEIFYSNWTWTFSQSVILCQVKKGVALGLIPRGSTRFQKFWIRPCKSILIEFNIFPHTGYMLFLRYTWCVLLKPRNIDAGTLSMIAMMYWQLICNQGFYYKIACLEMEQIIDSTCFTLHPVSWHKPQAI